MQFSPAMEKEHGRLSSEGWPKLAGRQDGVPTLFADFCGFLRIFADFYPQFFWAKNHLLSPYFLEKTQKNYSESRLITLNKNFPCPSTLHPFLFLKKLPNEPIFGISKMPINIGFLQTSARIDQKNEPILPDRKTASSPTRNSKPETRNKIAPRFLRVIQLIPH